MLKPKYIRDILSKYLKNRITREEKLEIINTIVKNYETLNQDEKEAFNQSYKQSQDKSSFILIYFDFEKLTDYRSSISLINNGTEVKTIAQKIENQFQETSEVKMVVRMPEEYREFMKICEKNSLDSKKILTKMIKRWIDKNKYLSIKIDYS